MNEQARTGRSDCGSFIVDRRGTILGFDQSLERLTGWPAVDVVGRTKDLGGSLPGGPLYDGTIRVVEGARSLPLLLHCRDGRQLEVESVAERLGGPGERTLVTVLRVLSISVAMENASNGTRRDRLTSLADAEAFRATLASDFSAAALKATPLALVLADIDHLREINDRHGHGVGNEVLQRVAGILRVCASDENRIFRLGEDDFALLLPGGGRGDARQLAATLRATVERYHFFPEQEHGDGDRVTLSLGAASFPADAETTDDLVERAHDALNEARELGRNRVWCYLRRPRVPVHVPVFFDGVESLLVGYARDLSPSGIFVQTAAPIEIGMRCALSFPLPGLDGRVHVIGRIVRTVPPDVSPESAPVRVPGMGVEFERFGGTTDRHAIDAFLHRHEESTLRPERGPLSVVG